MKKIIILTAILFALGCEKKESKVQEDVPCGDYKGEQLYRDTQGACYLMNSSGNKVYVDSLECNC
jgi:hypothetical protein